MGWFVGTETAWFGTSCHGFRFSNSHPSERAT